MNGGLDDDYENWFKIVQYENGNKDNYNSDNPGSRTNYQNRFYSHSVLIPANMWFKIRFNFDRQFNISSTYNNGENYVRTRIIRSGKWSTAAPGPKG